MKHLFFITCMCLSVLAGAQKGDSSLVTQGLRFGKREFLSRSLIKTEKFGKSVYSYNPAFFIDEHLKLNNRRFAPVGLMYRRVENYCRLNSIYYNKKELTVYRRQALLAGGLFGVACFGFLPVYFYAQDYSNRTGYNEWPSVFFKGAWWPVLWALPVVEGILACKIKGKAERRLKAKLFLEDAYQE